jgi:DNA-binding CsgD family transcriptional regulator
LLAAGFLRVLLGESLARGLALLEEAAALYRARGDARGLAWALIMLGRYPRLFGGAGYAAGTARLDEALGLARAAGDRRLVALVLTVEANSADLTRAGEPERARAAAEEGLALFTACGDEWGRHLARRALGLAALRQGDFEGARAAFAADLAAKRARGETHGIAHALRLLARTALARGDSADAVGLYRQSLGLSRDLGEWAGVAGDLEGLARAAAARGRPGRAARLLGAADAVRREAGRPPMLVDRPGAEAAAARAALGEAAFAAAWAEGRAMTLEQVVACALADEPASAAEAATGPPTGPGGLTRREVEVLRLLAAGRTNKEIGAALGLSAHTAARHVANVYRKIDAHNRADATAYAFRHGLTGGPAT